MGTTRILIDRLEIDKNLRRICGFENRRQIPSESTFSRAFDEFANTNLPQHIHESLIKKICKKNIIQHISNDSTAITAREKPKTLSKKKKKDKTKKKKRGRPKKEELKNTTPKKPSRLDKQPLMTLSEMLKRPTLIV